MVGFCPLTIPYRYSIQILHIVNELQVKNHFSDQSRADNSWTGKERVTVLTKNMLPLMFNISVKFHSDIPYSKNNYRQKTNSQINQGWITHNLERWEWRSLVTICNLWWSTYLWSFIQIFHIVNELQVKNHFSDQSRADNSWTGKVRVMVLCHSM